MQEPWSKKHKRVFKGCQFSLSNSFAQPLSMSELLELTLERGDQALIDEYNSHSLEYTPNGGSQDLKEEIAKLYGPNISAQNILVFPGGQVALQTAAMALARDGHSIAFTPGYQSTVQSPSWTTASSLTLIERKAENRWQIEIDKVRAAIRPDTKYMIINEPYNPGGIVMSKSLQQELVQLCDDNNIVLVCDEVYRLLEHDPDTTRIPAMADAYPSGGISAVTMSKPWGACGVTIGWLACANLKYMQSLIDVQYFGTACPSRASELQGIMVLRASNKILDQRIQIIRQNLKLLHEFINKYEEWFSWVEPNAGAIAFVRFKGPLTTEQLGDQLAQRGISMKPSYCFSDIVKPEIDYFRVGYGETKMPKALQALEAFVEEHKEEWSEAMNNKSKKPRT